MEEAKIVTKTLLSMFVDSDCTPKNKYHKDSARNMGFGGVDF